MRPTPCGAYRRSSATMLQRTGPPGIWPSRSQHPAEGMMGLIVLPSCSNQKHSTQVTPWSVLRATLELLVRSAWLFLHVSWWHLLQGEAASGTGSKSKLEMGLPAAQKKGQHGKSRWSLSRSESSREGDKPERTLTPW